MESLQPINNPTKIEILLGKKTTEKLQSLQNIRHTPIENLVENIIASAMQKDEKDWQELENSKPSIPNIKNEKKEFYTGDEVQSHIEALGACPRMENLLRKKPFWPFSPFIFVE